MFVDGKYNASPPTLADGQDGQVQLDATGNLRVVGTVAPVAAVASTGAITSVNDTNADTTILAANAGRKGATVYNDSSAILYLACANVTSSATVFTVKLQPEAFYELPRGKDGTIYTGVIKGIWSADSSGAARVTEWTA